MSILGKIGDALESAGGWVEGEVVGVAETAYHAGHAVYDAATGDWEGAADQSAEMANSALDVVTGGALGAAETTGDTVTGGDSVGTAKSALKRAGEWLGDEIYDLVHPDE